MRTVGQTSWPSWRGHREHRMGAWRAVRRWRSRVALRASRPRPSWRGHREHRARARVARPAARLTRPEPAFARWRSTRCRTMFGVNSPQHADSSGAPPSGVDVSVETSVDVPNRNAERLAWTGGPSANVAGLLRAAAARHPDRPALIATSGTRTWAALDRAADAGARRLTVLGASPRERVVISLPTGVDLALVLFAVARAGLIAVPTAPGAEVAEL